MDLNSDKKNYLEEIDEHTDENNETSSDQETEVDLVEEKTPDNL